MAEHLEGISHDHINRYLRGERLTPRLLWDNVKMLLQPSQNAYVLFDDTVLDKRYSASIELARRLLQRQRTSGDSRYWIN